MKEGLTGGALLSARGREKGGEVDRVRERMVGRWVHRPSRGERKKRGRKQLGRLEEKKKEKRERESERLFGRIKRDREEEETVWDSFFRYFCFANSNNCGEVLFCKLKKLFGRAGMNVRQT